MLWLKVQIAKMCKSIKTHLITSSNSKSSLVIKRMKILIHLKYWMMEWEVIKTLLYKDLHSMLQVKLALKYYNRINKTTQTNNKPSILICQTYRIPSYLVQVFQGTKKPRCKCILTRCKKNYWMMESLSINWTYRCIWNHQGLIVVGSHHLLIHQAIRGWPWLRLRRLREVERLVVMRRKGPAQFKCQTIRVLVICLCNKCNLCLLSKKKIND